MSAIVTYSLTITLVKISLLLLYRRIFSTAAFRKKSTFVGILCVIWFIITLCMDIFQCRPFDEAFRAETIFTNHCIDLQKFYWGATATNLGIDVIMLFLPLHMVWKLRLPTHQKLLLSGLFMLGVVVCIAGAMRIYYVGDMQKEDITVTAAAEYIWCHIEPATAILCACIVTYRPLFSSINLDFSMISSLFSKSSTKSSGKTWRAIEDGRNSPHRQWPVSRGLQGRDGLRSQDLDGIRMDVNIEPHGEEANTDLYPRSRSPQNVAYQGCIDKSSQTAVS
ncbi:hypothetical protein N7G274_003397 [Stereocaulon virgatum]|uniref:Rhodopsin domain-containing protein n=1 Tax=Stereocaulon virgatum TaxID=373712 RepID=A0ABR4AH03_9LECA